MMIHVCKALDIPSQEEVTADSFENIPGALDGHFFAHPLKARMDKTILAEMIGRVGPKKNIRPLLEKLLEDKDEDVRQYALNSLEYCGVQNPQSIMPFIEKYRQSGDEEMFITAAMLISNIQCSEQGEYILNKIIHWYKKGDYHFVQEVIKRMKALHDMKNCKGAYLNKTELKTWTHENCPKVAEAIYG